MHGVAVSLHLRCAHVGVPGELKQMYWIPRLWPRPPTMSCTLKLSNTCF